MLNQNVVSYSTQTPSSRSTPTSSTPTPSSCSVPSTSTLTLSARSNRLTKAQHALTQTPAMPSEALSSMTTTGSAGQVRSMKADLPPELVADGRWQRVLIPTLLLWAGGKDDVWSVTRGAVAYALSLIVDSNRDLDSSRMDWSWHGPIVSVVRHLLHPGPDTNTID